MSAKNKYIWLLFAVILFVSSCVTIEKRKYTGGYYVDLKADLPACTQGYSIEMRASQLTSSNTGNPEVIPISFVQSDTDVLSPPMSEDKSVIKQVIRADHNRGKNREHIHSFIKKPGYELSPIHFIVILVMIAGFVFTFLYRWAVWLVLAGLISFLLIMLNVAMIKCNKNPEISGSSAELLPKKVVPFSAFVALFAGIVACASYFISFGAVTILASIIGSFFSCDALQKIKRDPETKGGKGIVITGFVLNFLSLLFITYLLILYMQSVI